MDKNANGFDQIPYFPATPGLVRVDATRHAKQSGNVHRVKRQVETDREEPEMEFAQGFAQHPSRDFREPVIKRTEKAEQDPAYDHVVKVRDDEVGIAELPVKGCDGHHDAGKPGNQELEQESDAEQHRRLELNLSAPHRAEPVEDLDAGG